MPGPSPSTDPAPFRLGEASAASGARPAPPPPAPPLPSADSAPPPPSLFPARGPDVCSAIRLGLQSRESRELRRARRRREGVRGGGGPGRPHPASGQLRVLCAQEKRRLQEEIRAARRELEEEKLRVERLKVGGGRGRLLSPGNEVGVSLRVSTGNQRSLSLDMGLGELVPASGTGKTPQLGKSGWW